METTTTEQEYRTAILIIVNMVLTTLVPVLVMFLKRIRKCRSICCDIENSTTRSSRTASAETSPVQVKQLDLPAIVIDSHSTR
jgi:hypothetical protein